MTAERASVKIGQVWQHADKDYDPTMYTVKRTTEVTTLEGPDLGPDTMICICDTLLLLDPEEWKLVQDVP